MTTRYIALVFAFVFTLVQLLLFGYHELVGIVVISGLIAVGLGVRFANGPRDVPSYKYLGERRFGAEVPSLLSLESGCSRPRDGNTPPESSPGVG